eukprot:9026945-Pyramimonas_sp.AAC.1
MHYLDACFVNVVTLLYHNPTAIGLPAYFSSKVNYDTWHKFHRGDLPRVKLCGGVAVRPNDFPAGARRGEIPPWTTLSKREGTRRANVGQCTAGLRASHGVLIRSLIEIVVNHRLLRTPFERK